MVAKYIRMLHNRTISAVIPCKNEAQTLPILLKKIPTFIDEIIVVDNNSSDQSGSIAKHLNAKVVKEKRKDWQGVGYGFAHQTGLRIAKGDIILTLDADDSFPVSQLKSLISYFEENQLDFLSGNRFSLKTTRPLSFYRKVGNTVLNTLASVLFGHRFQDILCGFWIVRKTALPELQPQSGGWNFSPEIKLLAHSNTQMKTLEVPILFTDRKYDVSKQHLLLSGLVHALYLIYHRLFISTTLLKTIKKWETSLLSYN
jgi:glycosyltransferase involved in cell wall biosynthesis